MNKLRITYFTKWGIGLCFYLLFIKLVCWSFNLLLCSFIFIQPPSEFVLYLFHINESMVTVIMSIIVTFIFITNYKTIALKRNKQCIKQF